MEINDLKTRLRTDVALTLRCEEARVQLLKVAARQVLSHGPALEVFRQLDADGSGVLERGELRKAVKRLGVHGVLVDDVDSLLDILDPSGDGQVSFDEFVSALDAGLDVHLLLLPAPKHDADDMDLRADSLHPSATPLDLAERLYHFVANSPYGSSKGAGDASLVGLLRFCGQVEVLPTSKCVARNQDRQVVVHSPDARLVSPCGGVCSGIGCALHVRVGTGSWARRHVKF